MYFPRFLDEDAVEDSVVTISATLPVKCFPFVENRLELIAHSLYLHYSQVVLVFVAFGS